MCLVDQLNDAHDNAFNKKNKKRKIFVNFVIVLKSFQAMKNLLNSLEVR